MLKIKNKNKKADLGGGCYTFCKFFYYNPACLFAGKQVKYGEAE